MGNAVIISRANGVNKDYVDNQDNKKVDKENGKMLSSNDFTDSYKSKIESALQGIQCNGQNVNPYQNIVNLTPAILGAMVSNVIEKTYSDGTSILRFNGERISSTSIGNFYVVMSDRSGTGLFANMGTILIYHMAIDIGDPTRYLISIGYKANENTMHHLNVISNNAITIGDRNHLGTQVMNNTDGRESYIRQMALCVRIN